MKNSDKNINNAYVPKHALKEETNNKNNVSNTQDNEIRNKELQNQSGLSEKEEKRN